MRRYSLFALLILLAAPPSAFADTWPSKPIKAVVPFGAGSATDIIPRIVFEQLQGQLGQSIVVENRGGAGGTIGAAQVVKSDPDGYTWLVHSSAHTVAPAIYPSLSFKPEADLVPMSMIGSVPNVLIISPSKGIKTVQDFVAYGKANPGKMNFASVGIGSAVHMSAERFRVSAGYDGCAHSLQAWRRGAGRGDCGPCRLLLLPDRNRAAAYPRGQAAGACGVIEDARGAIAGRSDHPGSRLSGLRL